MISPNFSQLGLRPRRLRIKQYHARFRAIMVKYIEIRLTEKLQQLQNRAARIVTPSNYETCSKDLLDDLGWEVLVDKRMTKLATLMDKITHDISPPGLRNIFQNVSDVHSYNLRNSSINLYIPKPKLEIGKHSLHYRGSVLWNKIPVKAREQESLVLQRYSRRN